MQKVTCGMTLNPNPKHNPSPNPHQVSAASIPHITFRIPHITNTPTLGGKIRQKQIRTAVKNQRNHQA